MTGEDLKAALKKNPLSVGCAVLSVALIGAIYFRSDQIPAANAELEQKSDEAERLAANIKNSTQLKEQYDAVVAANKEIDSRIIRANQLAANAQFWYKVEADSGAKLIGDPRQTTTAAVKGKGIYSPIGFSVSFQGDITHLIHVLRILEGGVHYVRVLNGTVSLTGTARNAPLTMSLSIEMLGLP